MNTQSVKRKVSNQIITANFENMNTKIVYPIIIGLCLMLCGMRSSAQTCNLTITADAWMLYVQDTASGYTYTCSGQVQNSNGSCYSDVHDYGTVYSGPSGNSMPQYAYRNNHWYNQCTYWLYVVVSRSDGAMRTATSTAQQPDQNYHISPGTIRVSFSQ